MPVDLIIERISGATIGFSNLPLTRIVVVYASRDGDIYVLEIIISDNQWQTQIGFESQCVVDIMRPTRIALFINVLTDELFQSDASRLTYCWYAKPRKSIAVLTGKILFKCATYIVSYRKSEESINECWFTQINCIQFISRCLPLFLSSQCEQSSK